jgi:hypothetical protein
MMWVTILVPNPGGPQGNVNGFREIAVLFAGGAPLAALLGLVATLSAWGHGVKVWLDSSLHRARQAQQWPPHPSNARNTASEALGMMYVATLGVLLVPVFYLVDQFPVLQGWLSLVLLPFGLLLLAVVLWADARCAAHPSECWGDDGASPIGS